MKLLKSVLLASLFLTSISSHAATSWAGDRIIKNLYIQDDNTVLIEIENLGGMNICTYQNGAITAHLKLTIASKAYQNMFSTVLAAKASNNKIAVNYYNAEQSGNCSLEEMSRIYQVSI